MEILDLLYCTFLILFGCTYLLFNYKFYCKQKNDFSEVGDRFSGAYEVVKESEFEEDSEGRRRLSADGESTTEYESDDDDSSSCSEGDRPSGAEGEYYSSVDSYIKNIKKEIDVYKNYILIMENKLDIYLLMTSADKLLDEGEIDATSVNNENQDEVEMDITSVNNENRDDVEMDVTSVNNENQDEVEMDIKESTEHQDDVDTNQQYRAPG